jgi:hypothetical protein
VQSAALNGSNPNSPIQMAHRKRTKEIIDNPETNLPAHNLLSKLSEAGKRVEIVAEPEEVFRLFAMFVGDLERTAVAAHLPLEQVAEMSEAGNWTSRIKVLIRLQKSGIPGDVERGVNRAINFIQADRMRRVIERVINTLNNMSADEMLANLLSVTEDRNGNITSKILTRPFADLATALEKCHAMTYQALNDTATDRKGRSENEDSASASAGEMHLALVDAMSKARKPRVSGPHAGAVAGGSDLT